MADEDSIKQIENNEGNEQEEKDPSEFSYSSSEEEDNDSVDSSMDEEYDSDDFLVDEYIRERDGEELENNNTPESNIKRFSQIFNSKRAKQREEEEDEDYVFREDLFNFPKDPEEWKEEDLKELWADAPLGMKKPGWDPVWAEDEDWEVVKEEIQAGRNPPIAPFYLPYRKYYPAIPDNHHDISNPKAVIEELDRIEEFLKWVSYIFPDGSS